MIVQTFTLYLKNGSFFQVKRLMFYSYIETDFQVLTTHSSEEIKQIISDLSYALEGKTITSDSRQNVLKVTLTRTPINSNIFKNELILSVDAVSTEEFEKINDLIIIRK